jgi:hypothetical protein
MRGLDPPCEPAYRSTRPLLPTSTSRFKRSEKGRRPSTAERRGIDTPKKRRGYGLRVGNPNQPESIGAFRAVTPVHKGYCPCAIQLRHHPSAKMTS